MGKSQLLQNCNSSSEPSKGIKLPYGFVPNDITVLYEPSPTCSRAVVLLTSRYSVGMNYVLCQLQLIDDEEVARNFVGSRVLGNLSYVDTFQHNSLLPETSSTQIVAKFCGVFFAGASFRFNLLAGIQNNIGSIATIGILHNLGQSVASLDVSSSRETRLKSVFHLGGVAKKVDKIQVVEKIWISDIVEKPKRGHNDIEYTMNWSFLKSDGGNLIWSVPLDGAISGSEGYKPIVVGPIQLFPDDDPEMSKVFLGPLPLISERFLIYSAQHRRQFNRNIPLSNSRLLESEQMSTYSLSDCIIGAPSFTPSLILQLSQRSIDRKVSIFLNSRYSLD